MADPITLPKKVLKSPQRVCPASEEGAVGQGIDHCVLAGLGASPQGWVQGGTFNGAPATLPDLPPSCAKHSVLARAPLVYWLVERLQALTWGSARSR